MFTDAQSRLSMRRRSLESMPLDERLDVGPATSDRRSDNESAAAAAATAGDSRTRCALKRAIT